VTRDLKNAFFAAASQTGVSGLFARSSWRRRRLLILGYHGVSLGDEHDWDPYLFISTATFERRLEILHRTGCHVLPLAEAVERLYRGDLPDRAVCLTFDDGYYNFLVRAYPRLRQYRFPATVYLNTLGCEHGLPLVRIGLSYVMWKSGRTQLEGHGLPGLENRTYTFETPDARTSLAVTIHDALLAAGAEAPEQNAVLRDVATRVAVNYDPLVSDRVLTLMNPPEVRALAAEGVDFQLHTHRHTNPVDPEAFRCEIRENSWRIEGMTGRRPAHFCYPSGIYRQSYLPVLESEGVVSATTTEPGIVSTAEARLLLPRFIDMDAVSDAEFENWLSGLAPCLRGTLKGLAAAPRHRLRAGAPAPPLIHQS
jgi:peptidoglycan/xylan/chitin deacetylase (PgdA/CDA1 family)